MLIRDADSTPLGVWVRTIQKSLVVLVAVAGGAASTASAQPESPVTHSPPGVTIARCHHRHHHHRYCAPVPKRHQRAK